MTMTISGKFESVEDARRATSRLEREGVPVGAMEVTGHDEGAEPQPEGLRGITDSRATGGRRGTLSVRVGTEHDAQRAAQLLRAAGAHDVDAPSRGGPRSVLGAAGSAFGMAIAEAATAPMAGATASNAQGPATDTRPVAGTDKQGRRVTAADLAPEDPGDTGVGARPATGIERKDAAGGDDTR